MTRISREELFGAVELFVNAIYDDEECGWTEASLEDWQKAVYEELTTWKSYNGCSYHSNENRFEGKEEIMKKVNRTLKTRLTELVEEEGYKVKAYEELNKKQ